MGLGGLGTKDKKVFGLKCAVNLCENAIRKRIILHSHYTLGHVLRKKENL